MLNRMRKFTEEREQGFTLIELLVVIIIIGILAAIAIPVFLNQRKKGVDASLKSDLKSAATAAETWATDNPSAPLFSTAAPAPVTTVQANFTGAGFKRTGTNTVEVKGGPAGGYCIRARNDGASTATGDYFYYDSSLGGLAAGASAAGPTGGACAAAGTFTAIT